LWLVSTFMLACPFELHEAKLGDFVLRYTLLGSSPLPGGERRYAFAATLENQSTIHVGSLVVVATSAGGSARVAQGRLDFPPLAPGQRLPANRVLRIDSPAEPDPSALQFELLSVAPPLAASTPAGGAADVSGSEWIQLGFAAEPADEAAQAIALSCEGSRRRAVVTALAERVVVNPAASLPASADCTVGWVGAGGRAARLAFRTQAPLAAATVRYDRAVTAKNNPLPDDYFTGPDDSTPTGLRVQIPVPTVDAGTRVIAASTLPAANRLDGFSPHGPIVLEVSEPADPDDLPVRPEDSLDPLAPLALIELTPGSPRQGQRVPFTSQQRSDRIANGPLEHTLFVFPAVQLERGGRYGLVATRRLRAASGAGFELGAYLDAALGEPEPGEHGGLAKLRPLVREVAAAAADLPVPILADDLAFALRFTVGSLEGVFDVPLAMREQLAALPPPTVRITRVGSAFGPFAAIVEGTFESPWWLDDFEILARDEEGKPRFDSTFEIPFVLALPRSATTTPAPLVFFQHGTPGTASGVTTVADQGLAQAGFAVVGFTDTLNRTYGPDSNAQLQGIYLALIRTQEMPGYWIQALGEQLAFLRALEQLGSLDALPVGAPDGVGELDLDAPLAYFGQSAGATAGAMLLPYAPEIRAAQLMVGGGRLAESLVHQAPREGGSIITLVGDTFPRLRPSELWAGFHSFQMIFDFQEAQTHAARLYRDPIEVAGTTRKASILWTEGLNDSFIPPTSRRAAAHAIGLPLLEPVRENVAILDIEATPVSANVDADTTGGVFQYVPDGVTGIPPTPGCEFFGTDGHFCAQLAPASWLQRVQFFQSALGAGAPVISNPFVDTDEDGLADFEELERGTDPANPDSDADGIPDGFEAQNSLNPLNAADAALDYDGDGLVNRAEYEAGSHPFDWDTDRDGLRDGDEVNVHGTDPTLADSDGGGRGDGPEVNRDGTDPRDGADDLPLRELPFSLTDSNGLPWIVMSNGSLRGGAGGVLVDSASLVVDAPFDGSFPFLPDASLGDAGELVLGPSERGGLRVTREVFLSSEGSFVRHLDVVENPTASPITTSISLSVSVFAIAAESSSGDQTVDPSDDWMRFVGDSFRSAVVVGWNGRLAELQPVSASGGGFSFGNVRFDVTIPPGERAIFLTFHFLSRTEAEARAAVERLVRLDEPLFEGVSLEERADVVNFFALPDADDDGLADADESAFGSDPEDPDSDGDGLVDGFETRAGFDPLVSGEAALDSDGDGLDNLAEQAAETDPTLPDTDGDGLPEGQEVALGTGPRNPDSDADGLLDGFEVMLGTDPLDRFGDADGDGLDDASEVRSYETDPTNPDSDGDGLPDGFEVQQFILDPNDPSDAAADFDADGLSNLEEYERGTFLQFEDSDFDGLLDGEEVHAHGTNPRLRDTDGGTRSDFQEVKIDETDPLDAADDLDSVFLPLRLFDGAALPWDIQSGGRISGFPTCSSCGNVYIGSFSPFFFSSTATAEEDGREVRIEPAETSNVRLRRKVFVPSDDRFARYLDSFENLLGVPQTVTVRLETTLSSFEFTQIVGSSDGDAMAEAEDDFVIADDFEGFGIAALALVFSDAAAPLQPTSVQLDAQRRIQVTFSLTLEPGERRTLMYFLSQNTDRVSALLQGAALRDLGGSALVGLSDAEREQIANFALPSP
jgi:hypothetical protein